MNIACPPTHTGPIADAFQRARNENIPILVPVSVFADDRGWSVMNQFQNVLDPTGQLNYSVMYPSVIKAWHYHQKQTDFWLCLHGHLKIGIHRESDKQSWLAVIGEKNPAVAIIPPPLWHGAATVGPQSAGLLYYVTQQYDPANPDEQRQPHDAVKGFPWQTQHR